MTKTQEFSGKDVNIAIKNACSALCLSKDKLKYDVISEGTSGIFGIVGRKEARIRVFLPEIDDSEEKEGILSMVDEAFGGGTRREEKPLVSGPETEEDDDDGDSDDYVDDFANEEIDEDTYENVETDEEETEEDAVDVTEESVALGVETLQKIADLITEDAKVSAQTEGNRLTLCIEGGNSGILIGRKGQTLDAMQFLTDKIINRKSEARVRVRVDIEGYMETRKSNLKHLAYKMADKAKKTGRPATINQMSAQDRRIVHLALKDDTKVRTQSMGEGYYRRLVIFPKKKTAFKGKRRVKK
ncbi:MAG: Jag N-terminal domain-containing protein [Desulfobacula sp.]|nr:Jag N-terminal domain-containing protein [Desulfobacula sp.]MDA8134430.1 Jag N-terminal domain-containing protein [Desulfobacteraceae bacterium]